MAKAAEKPKAAEADEFKYSLETLAETVGLAPASIRAALRDSDFKREGARWGWNTKAEFDSVVKFFKERAARAPAVTAKADKPAKAKTAAKSKPKAKAKAAA